MGSRPITCSLSDALFSRVQSRVLAILFGSPHREFQLTEIIERADSARGAVQRELEKLTAAGIVALATRGTQTLYHVNRQSPIHDELRQLIAKSHEPAQALCFWEGR